MGLSADEIAYIKKFNTLYPLKFQAVTEITDEESEGSFKDEIRQILLEKLEEMLEVGFEDCADGEYPEICSVMNDIAKTLLEK